MRLGFQGRRADLELERPDAFPLPPLPSPADLAFRQPGGFDPSLATFPVRLPRGFDRPSAGELPEGEES